MLFIKQSRRTNTFNMAKMTMSMTISIFNTTKTGMIMVLRRKETDMTMIKTISVIVMIVVISMV